MKPYSLVITFSNDNMFCDHKVYIQILQYVLVAAEICLIIKLYTSWLCNFNGLKQIVTNKVLFKFNRL